MGAIFLSASVPIVGRGNYHETADPFLIQCAVRELVIAAIKDFQIVWGGHPAITPMIWAICQDLDVKYAKSVILYQSRFFAGQFPEENIHFGNVVFVDAVQGDREGSLRRLRESMLSRQDIEASVFIGGMEGVEAEYAIFKQIHPDKEVLIVPSPGGAALQLAERLQMFTREGLGDLNFARLFHSKLSVLKNRANEIKTNISG